MTSRKSTTVDTEVHEAPTKEQRPSSGTVKRVTLVGRLVADPGLRSTALGIPVTTVRVATNDRGNAEFHDVVLWRQFAEFATTYMGKGRLAYIERRLQSRTWQTADGSSRTVTEILADRFQELTPQRQPEQAA